MRFGATSLFLLTALVCLRAQTKDETVLLFAGDVVLSDNVETFVGSRIEYVFERWKPGRESDIFMVNLEHPITMADAKVEKKYNFKMNPAYLPILKDAGITLVNCANNHVFDYGMEGIYDTMAYLDSVGVKRVGVGRNLEEARRPVILERNGRKIGFLGYYGGGDYAASKDRAGFAPRRTRYVVEDVRKLRSQADFVVVNFHWGTERAETPDEWQTVLAHRVIDAGADLIVGHHPHVLQGIERYKGKHIAYSLGNFVFGGNSLSTYDTAVLRVVLSGDESKVEVVPVHVRRWQPIRSEGNAKEQVLQLVQERSEHFTEQLYQTGVKQ